MDSKQVFKGIETYKEVDWAEKVVDTQTSSLVSGYNRKQAQNVGMYV